MRPFLSILKFLCDLSANLIGPKAYNIKAYDLLINGIKIRVYSPNKYKVMRPVVIYYHGGGWILGSIKSYDRLLQFISFHGDCIVVAIEYRKAPEYKFPIALNDAYLGYRWTIENISVLEGDLANVIVCGDSAGGNLAVGLLKMLHDEKAIIPSLLILIYPLLETKISFNRKLTKSKFQYILYKISAATLKYCLKHYLTNLQDYESPYISLIDNFNKNIEYPATLIIISQLDCLTFGINSYAKKLESLGTKVTIKEYPYVFHGFLNFSRISKEANLALHYIANYIKNSSYN